MNSFYTKEMQEKLSAEHEQTKNYEIIDKICKSKNKLMEVYVKQDERKNKFNYFDLNLRYCHISEVHKKQHKIILLK